MKYCNELCVKLRQPEAICSLCKAIDESDKFSSLLFKFGFTKVLYRFISNLFVYIGTKNTTTIAFIVFIIMLFPVCVIAFFHFNVQKFSELGQWILVASFGMLFDILIIVWFVKYLESLGEEKRQIKGYKEEIQDFLDWRSDEARHRLQGHIRRLSYLGVTDMCLKKAYLKGPDLWNVDLTNADLKDANLENANLLSATLADTDLSEANLKGADLSQANVCGAVLDLADLRGTDFSYARHMKQEQLKHIRWDENTKLPRGLELPERSLLYHDGFEPDGNRVITIDDQLEELSRKLDQVIEMLQEQSE